MQQTEALYTIFQKSSGVSTDTRQDLKNKIFFALSGPNFNGNSFAEQALKQGALLAIIDDETFAQPKGTLLVKNVLKTLQALATHHRHQLTAEVIAITGSNGKTTTKELAYAVLSATFKTQATQGNLNNHIGVPLTLLSIEKNTQMAIVEMGANKPGDIKELVEIAEPDFGLITNVGMAHLEGFGSFEGVMRTKAELYDFLKKKKANIFLHADNVHLQQMASEYAAFTYGSMESKAQVKGRSLMLPDLLVVEWTTDGKTMHRAKTNLIGNYNLPNVLAAVAIGVYFGVSAAHINAALEAYVPSNHRSQLLKTEYNTLLLDAYNANPSSMDAALQFFSQMEVKPKCVILGKMAELGVFAKEAHQKLQDSIERAEIDKCILLGEEYEQRNNQQVYSNKQLLIEALQRSPIQGYTILIKGSRSNKLEEIVPYL